MTARAQAAIAQDADWARALDSVTEQTGQAGLTGELVDLAFLFASAGYGEHLPELVRRARDVTGAGVLIGCSGQGIVGGPREVEGEPAVSLLKLSLPGARLHQARISQGDLDTHSGPEQWRAFVGLEADAASGWILFVDPFRLDVERLVEVFSAAYPGLPLIGGLASGEPTARQTYVFLNDQVYDEGAVAVALGGAYSIQTIVSQGAEPISETWTITGAEGPFVETIGQRPAVEVLVGLLKGLTPEDRRRIQNNLLVGLAIDEYRDEFRRGDFLVRNLGGVNQRTGVLAVGGSPRVGQTIQFQVRDAQAADEELRLLLSRARETLGEREALAAVLCTCNGRGVGLFGQPDHDARAIADLLGIQSIAGFFCNGEIGPVGQKNFLHGYTASIALIVPNE